MPCGTDWHAVSGTGRGTGRVGSAGRGFDGEMDPSQGQYGFYNFGYQGMMPGYQVGYPMYGYSSMFPGYGYGYSQLHPAAFHMQGAAFNPRAMPFQAGRGYAMAARSPPLPPLLPFLPSYSPPHFLTSNLWLCFTCDFPLTKFGV